MCLEYEKIKEKQAIVVISYDLKIICLRINLFKKMVWNEQREQSGLNKGELEKNFLTDCNKIRPRIKTILIIARISLLSTTREYNV
jgi:hypothetical protein